MIVNELQITQILSGDKEASKHWIFKNLIDNEYLYEGIRISKDRIVKIKEDVMKELETFYPLNDDVFNVLFPHWKEIEKKMDVQLVVGCPIVYDMMERDGIIVIDIQNLDKYLEEGHDMKHLLQVLITHEFTHMCINHDYQMTSYPSYLEQLDYLLFQEGFAHAIPYLKSMDAEKYAREFEKAIRTLKEAVKETDLKKQKDYLIKADTGEYWEKFGAIASKLYILSHKDNLLEIYQKGYHNFHEHILAYYIDKKDKIKE